MSAVPESYWQFQRGLDLFFQVTTADATPEGGLLTGTLLADTGAGVECLAEGVALPLSAAEWAAVLDSRCEAHKDDPIGFGDEIQLRLVIA